MPFRVKYACFRELLAANDLVLGAIAEVEDRLNGEVPFGLAGLRGRLEAATLNAFIIVKDLNLISDGRHAALYDALERVDAAIRTALGPRPPRPGGPLVVAMDEVARDQAGLLGAKMANLGDARRLGLRVPDGFVVTAVAFDRLVEHNGLASRPASDPEAQAGARTRAAFAGASIPGEVRGAMAAAWGCLRARAGSPVRLAVRSSAVDEDGLATFAGQHRTVLNVGEDGLAAAYLEVIASLYDPGAVAYRDALGLDAGDARMAVGCVAMVDAAAAGVMFTRDPARPGDPLTVIDAVPGQGAGAVDGSAAVDHFVAEDGPPVRVAVRRIAEKVSMLRPSEAGGLVDVPLAEGRGAAPSIGDGTIADLVRTGRLLEAHFGGPQDVEWAVDRDGRVHVLQVRPLVPRDARPDAGPPGDHEVLIQDGAGASPGVAAGPVVRVDADGDLDRVPEGAVLVARHSSPRLAEVLPRVAAVVTEVGGVTGHMAIVARELGVPAILGAASARDLPSGLEVTVDATRGRVYRGRVPGAPAGRRKGRAPIADAAASRVLEAVAPSVVPLHLTDPAGPGFTPASCTSLHDITRFAHEMTFAVMFHIGDDVERSDGVSARRLTAPLPIEVYLLDVGGALGPDAGAEGPVRVEDLAGSPIRAFVGGLTDPRLRAERPRSVSFGGFMSVLSQGMVNPPPSRHELGRRSFAVASDTYLNFSTRAGYHFSTLDTYCGRSLNKNYIHFRFLGGAAGEDRRARRAAFVGGVLERRGFAIHRKGDLLAARLQKYERGFIEDALRSLGRLTICARQLDMLMDRDESVDAFVKAFLSEDYEAFS